MKLQLQETQDRYKAFADDFRKENPLFQVGNNSFFNTTSRQLAHLIS